jgi:hypothetical protein
VAAVLVPPNSSVPGRLRLAGRVRHFERRRRGSLTSTESGTWPRALGPPVRKGERAIWILAPMTRKIREQDDNGEINEKTIVAGFKFCLVIG